MDTAGTETGTATGRLEILDHRECLALLGTVRVGRISYTEQGVPATVPVSYVVAGGTVVIRSAWGSKLAAAARHTTVAFEADAYDERSRTGWSVTAAGRARLVERVGSPEEYAELDRLDLRPWVPGPHDHFIRIAIERVTGRRITSAVPDGDASEPLVETLDENSCLRLIAPAGVGRIAFHGRYGLTVLPVNYVFHEGAVVFRTTPGGAMDEDLRTGISGADYVIAFEIDRLDERTREGWSVLLHGTAHHVEDPAERATLAELPVHPWPGGPKDRYFRIVPTRVTGRRIHRPE